MKLAIMQPYFLPYIGYFQLINSVDKFVVYDDVNYIKKGWINRNYILLNGKKHLFTLPLSDASQNTKINKLNICEETYFKWLIKFKKMLQQSYGEAEFFNEVITILSNFLDSPPSLISDLNTALLKVICEKLEIKTEFVDHSNIYNNINIKGQDRIIDICKKEKADTYVNLIGGENLYSKEVFGKTGIDLKFVKANLKEYNQFGNEFIPSLSIIDVMMFNSGEKIRDMSGVVT